MNSKNEINYDFIFLTEDNKEIKCELIFSFYNKNNDKQYLIFTDNTYDQNKNLKIYAYYVTSNDQTLNEVCNKDELDIIEKIYKNLQGKEDE